MSAQLAYFPAPELDLGLPEAKPRQRPRRSRRQRVATPDLHMWIQPVLSDAMLAVGEFHTAFGLPLHLTPQQHVPAEVAKLRVALLEEEVGEFRAAVHTNDLVAIADALGDIAYVLYGAALTYGINLDAVIAEVHRSNMSKLGPDGVPLLREDGKVLKPPTFSQPDLRSVLDAQVPLPFRRHNEGLSAR